MNHFDLKHILENRTPEEKADILAHEYGKIEDVLMRNGFVACDIPACNCGSWHHRYGLPERYEELKEQLAEARRDAERVAWLMDRAMKTGDDDYALRPHLTLQDEWCINYGWEDEIRLGDGPVPTFTPESRAIIDAAMAAE